LYKKTADYKALEKAGKWSMEVLGDKKKIRR
jgi:hypothetical protein